MDGHLLRVLLVEDNYPEKDLWKQAVSRGVNSGLFAATRVDSLSRALALLESESFDAILLDLSLPDSLGISTFSEVYTRVPEVPIVVTTVAQDDHLAAEVLRGGAQDYLIKGNIDGENLRRALLFAIERHRSRAILHQMSFYDDLTGLLNRRGFMSLALQQLKIAERENWELAVLFADLDGLKHINDNFGHAEGDRALRTIAAALRETFRTSDLFGRLGGDEFIVMALNAPAPGVAAMLERLKRSIERHNAQIRYYRISLSIGIAQYDPHQGSSLEDLILRADQALYQNKRQKQE